MAGGGVAMEAADSGQAYEVTFAATSCEMTGNSPNDLYLKYGGSHTWNAAVTTTCDNSGCQ